MRFLLSILFVSFTFSALAETLPRVVKKENNVMGTDANAAIVMDRKSKTPLDIQIADQYVFHFDMFYNYTRWREYTPTNDPASDEMVKIAMYVLSSVENQNNAGIKIEAAQTLNDPCITKLGDINTQDDFCNAMFFAAYLREKVEFYKDWRRFTDEKLGIQWRK